MIELEVNLVLANERTGIIKGGACSFNKFKIVPNTLLAKHVELIAFFVALSSVKEILLGLPDLILAEPHLTMVTC
jgi:hypothetical protein